MLSVFAIIYFIKQDIYLKDSCTVVTENLISTGKAVSADP
jgi:hypothetical protein